jgi:hypothetical protein
VCRQLLAHQGARWLDPPARLLQSQRKVIQGGIRHQASGTRCRWVPSDERERRFTCQVHIICCSFGVVGGIRVGELADARVHI